MTWDLNTSIEVGQLGLFCFYFASAIAPLFLAPFCELVGRSVIYISAYSCCIRGFLGLALAENIEIVPV